MRIVPLFLSSVLCFSYDIHRYLGENLCRLLEKDGKFDYINKTLKGEPCSEASIWADKVKSVSRYRWTINLHYINIEECLKKYNKKYIDQECHGQQCIVAGILNSYDKIYDLDETEHLKLLMHLTQDFFQPLHIYGIFRGGNDIDLVRNKNGFNRSMNLHQMFDGEIFEYFIETENYVPSITNKKCAPKTTNPFIPLYKIDNSLYKKVEDIAQFGCKIYSKLPESNYVVFEEFYDKTMIKTLLDSYFNFAYELFSNIS